MVRWFGTNIEVTEQRCCEENQLLTAGGSPLNFRETMNPATFERD